MPAWTAMILLRTITAAIDLAELHANQIENPDPCPGQQRLDPKAEELGKNEQADHAISRTTMLPRITMIWVVSGSIWAKSDMVCSAIGQEVRPSRFAVGGQTFVRLKKTA